MYGSWRRTQASRVAFSASVGASRSSGRGGGGSAAEEEEEEGDEEEGVDALGKGLVVGGKEGGGLACGSFVKPAGGLGAILVRLWCVGGGEKL